MNPIDESLIQLLRLREGHLDTEQARQLREHIERDDQLRRRWGQVEQAYAVLSGDHTYNSNGAGLPEADVPPLDAQLVAAYIEGRLDEQAALRLEAACWISRQQMLEVVDSFCFYCTPPEASLPSPYLDQRLLALGEWSESPSDVSQANTDQPNAEASLPGSPSGDEIPAQVSGNAAPSPPPVNGDLQVDVDDKTSLPSSSYASAELSKSLWLWPIVAAALLVCILLGGIGLLLSRPEVPVVDPSPPRPDTLAPSMRDKNPDDVEPLPDPQIADQPSPEDPPPEDRLIIQPEFIDPEMQDSTNDDQIAPEAFRLVLPSGDELRPVLPDDEVHITDVPLDAVPNDSVPVPQEDQIALSVQWSDMRGLLAVRDESRQAWVGPDSLQGKPVKQFVTLPDSWVAGSTSEIGEIVIDADASVRLTKSTDGPTKVTAAVDRGKFAFRGLPSEARLRVQAGSADWSIQVDEHDSTIGVDWHQGQPRLIVRRGAVKIDTVPVVRGQQIFGRVSSGFMPKPEPIVGRTSWIDRPDRRVARMSDATRARLMSSSDLLADFSLLRSSRVPVERQLMARWSISLDPVGTLGPLLNSDNAEQRKTAFEWLLSQDPSSQQGRTMWQTLLQITGDAATVRAISKWARMARGSAVLQRNDALQMTQLLDSPQMVFRQAAAFFLQLAFGNPYNYRPDGNPVARRNAARNWARSIQRHYAGQGSPDTAPNAVRPNN